MALELALGSVKNPLLALGTRQPASDRRGGAAHRSVLDRARRAVTERLGPRAGSVYSW